VAFVTDHASTGHNSRISGNLPAQAMTWEQFCQANAHRRIAPEVLRTRFEVADADDDGLLTADEITRHRVIAARNKAQSG
jgi:hypothetical protein